MGEVGKYVLSVSAAAILCAVAVKLSGTQGTQSAVIKLIAGLLLTFTVAHPLSDWGLAQWKDIPLDISRNAQLAAGEGEALTKQALADGIISRSEAYILDKAEALGLSLEVKVAVTEDALPVPETVWLSGQASPYAKAQLTSAIQQDLGIAREDQIWN